MHHRYPPAVAAALGLALAGSLVGGQAAAAGTSPSSPRALHSTSFAKASGVTRPGQAYMGWSIKGSGQRHLAAASAVSPAAVPGPAGIDVSAWNSNVDWAGERAAGSRFAYVKATEGNYYSSSTFNSQYTGSANAGLIRGAYHFANPSVSSGASQADYFVQHGGGWSPDGITLPGVLDIEYNPYGSTCYGLSPSQMTSWIASFTGRYKALTGRDAIIYSTSDWWKQCTGDTNRFSGSDPLWIARYASTPGTLPGGWGFYTFWQYSATPKDQDWFNGSLTRLRALARGTCALPISKPRTLRVLYQGRTGADVVYLQRVLNALGDKLAVDGDFGPATKSAVMAFQRSQHIGVDGVVGSVTWSRLQSALAAVTCK